MHTCEQHAHKHIHTLQQGSGRQPGWLQMCIFQGHQQSPGEFSLERIINPLTESLKPPLLERLDLKLSQKVEMMFRKLCTSPPPTLSVSVCLSVSVSLSFSLWLSLFSSMLWSCWAESPQTPLCRSGYSKGNQLDETGQLRLSWALAEISSSSPKLGALQTKGWAGEKEMGQGGGRDSGMLWSLLSTCVTSTWLSRGLQFDP